MIEENINAIGSLKIELFNELGILVQEYLVKNLVVSTGKNWIVSRMGGNTSGIMSHMNLGTGTTVPAVTDIDLVAPLTRTLLQSSVITDNTISHVCNFGPGVNTGAITEAGIFNAATAGTMLNRTTFAVVNKSIADTVIITWNITIS